MGVHKVKEKKMEKKRVPWPDLPQQLLGLTRKDPTLNRNMNFQAMFKTLRLSPAKCNPNNLSPHPWLATSESYSHFEHEDYDRYFYSYFYYYTTWYMGQPPIWPADIPFKCAALSATYEKKPWEPLTLMALTGISRPAFLFYKFHRHSDCTRRWIKQDCLITEPHLGHGNKWPPQRHRYMQFTNLIAFEGKFYALSLQGTLAVVEVTDVGPRITAHSTTRAIPSIPFQHFKEYLVETGGQILVVFLVLTNKSVDAVQSVEVFRLHLGRLSWVKMEGLGDKVLFIGGNCCLAISASRVGSSRDCVYFKHESSGDMGMRMRM